MRRHTIHSQIRPRVPRGACCPAPQLQLHYSLVARFASLATGALLALPFTDGANVRVPAPGNGEGGSPTFRLMPAPVAAIGVCIWWLLNPRGMHRHPHHRTPRFHPARASSSAPLLKAVHLSESIGTWQTDWFRLPDGRLQQTCCAGCGLAFAALSTSACQPIFAGAGAPTWPREEGWLYMVTMIQARGHSSRYDARYLFLPGRSAAACVLTWNLYLESAAACVLTWKIRRSLCSPNVILCDSLLCRSGPRILLGVPYDTPEVCFLGDQSLADQSPSPWSTLRHS